LFYRSILPADLFHYIPTTTTVLPRIPFHSFVDLHLWVFRSISTFHFISLPLFHTYGYRAFYHLFDSTYSTIHSITLEITHRYHYGGIPHSITDSDTVIPHRSDTAYVCSMIRPFTPTTYPLPLFGDSMLTFTITATVDLPHFLLPIIPTRLTTLEPAYRYHTTYTCVDASPHVVHTIVVIPYYLFGDIVPLTFYDFLHF